ncbi:hypothetical protein [Bacillus thuringiensis]|uniref:hypothetical protein n=1 Tax=Bacillus thuringiensis TaxID=1428 RepID=UPI000BFCD904|nr:hypothetical protein [Bacillus thuringiensis]PGM50832.1 hypothetical protein CN949_16205 [Bacillus thuringiensis]
MKMNRGQLLEKAFKGEFKAGDTFKSNRDDIIIFNGENFVWKDDNRMLRMRIFNNESWVVYNDVEVKLSQKELNTLVVAFGNTTLAKIEQNNRHKLEIVGSTYEARQLFSRLEDKQAKAGI